ncbi:MAG TPA: DNA-processing protein DprA [Candidatus Krumholzibacteria bacterium]
METRDRVELLLTPGMTREDWARLEDAYHRTMAGEDTVTPITRVLCRYHLKLFNEDIDRQCAALERTGARLVFRWEPDYPAALRAIAEAPHALFVRGELPADDRPVIAIVGTRKPSTGGSALAYELARTLSMLGVLVVSGMARGIDTAAHHGALDAGAPTVAVLGTGVDVAYPPENAMLMGRIARDGAVVSEQLCGMHASRGVFPRRNRIISGMSDAVVVVEGGIRSGALITARWAADQGRDVGAVPGFPGGFRSQGPNQLLREGAFVVEHANDVVSHVKRIAERVRLESLERAQGDGAGLDGDAARVYDVVSNATTVDDVALATGLPVEHAQSLLTLLEIEGRIWRDDAGNYARSGPRRQR